MRLWVRLALVMALVAVAPVVVVGFLAMDIATRRAQDASEARLRREAAVHAEFVGRWVRDRAQLVGEMPQMFPQRLGALAPAYQSGFLNAVYRTLPEAVTVVLVDRDGLPVVSPVYAERDGERPASNPRRAQQLLDRLPLTEALAEPQGMAVGSAWLPAGYGSAPSVPIAAVAAVGAGDDPEGTLVLGVEITLDVASDVLGHATRDHGIVLLDGQSAPLLGGEHPLIQPTLLAPLVRTVSDFRYTLSTGEVRGAAAPVPYTDWTVAVVEPAEVVLRPSVEIRARMLPAVLVAAAVALLLAFVLASDVSEPVERLRNAALGVAEGRHGALAEVARHDEIGELARAFDHMSARLQENRREIEAQQAEIEAFNRELQDRVDERTRQLADAQTQLVRSGQLAAVAEVGAGLAHDLNNPLAAILGIAQVLRARHAGGADVRLLEDLEAQAERCRRVVAAMVRFSSGELDPVDAPVVDLADVLRDVTNLVGGPFRQRGVSLHLVDPPKELPVRVDPVHASRILAQVLGALRAGLPSGASVRVQAEQNDDCCVVRFEPDRPLAVTASAHDDQMASSLGLWVARRLLDQLGGRLETPGLAETPDGGDRAWRVTLPGA